eukprot:Nitzschia sp. Nitz4//scaffold11_size288233//83873//84427//NITZ4_000753-RA/size288233-processed-gene-0.213-mRNA-1//-1//CDS//3329534011//2637//frame0
MVSVAVVYFSGYGHNKVVAEAVIKGANAKEIVISPEGEITPDEWETLSKADAIIFGAPTYMGGPAWQFKKFAEATSKVWFAQGWKDKLFGGFSCSASLNGDKQVTLIYMQTLASQHGGVWASLGYLPSNAAVHTRKDINNLGGSVGCLVQCPSDSGADAIPSGDLETAKLYGERVSQLAAKFNP